MEYISVAQRAEAEIVIKKSRFIGNVSPARTVQEALEFISAVRQKYSDATHNVYAYSVGTGVRSEKASDDGEPRGTAGYPVLEVIKKRNLTNVVCVVTRYFGGILLGAGGLIRAYGTAASLAMDKAGISRWVYHDLLCISVDYEHFGRIQRELETRGCIIRDTAYADRVTVKSLVLPDETENLRKKISDLTSGKALISVKEGQYVPR